MASKDEDYLSAVIEDMDDRFDLILEVLDSIKDLPSELKDIKEMLTRLQHDHDLFYASLKKLE